MVISATAGVRGDWGGVNQNLDPLYFQLPAGLKSLFYPTSVSSYTRRSGCKLSGFGVVLSRPLFKYYILFIGLPQKLILTFYITVFCFEDIKHCNGFFRYSNKKSNVDIYLDFRSYYQKDIQYLKNLQKAKNGLLFWHYYP